MSADAQQVPQRRIEDYGLVGSLATSALVSRSGSIDWLPLPRFDSPAAFCALLGGPEHGRWLIAPQQAEPRVTRRYLDGTLVIETTMETAEGSVQLLDFMPISEGSCEEVVRIVRGLGGRVPMRFELCLRFDYGRIRPWLTRLDGETRAIAGPDAVCLEAPVELEWRDATLVSDFTVEAGQELPFVLTWHRSYEPPPARREATALLRETVAWWKDWSGRGKLPPDWREPVRRSLITLKAMTDRRTGGMVAAATTSLPERLGGVRNWDYRFCWVRDAAFALYALMTSGYWEEARAWREWLRRAVAGDVGALQVMYGLAGERRLEEMELPWLPGFAGSAPVRTGNDAFRQRQLDVYGEVMDAFHTYRMFGMEKDEEAWRLELELLPFVEAHWQEAGSGIWERRSHPRRYVTSRVLCWVAVDRAIKGVERFGLEGPLDRWRALRARIHEDVCTNGYSERRGAFVEAIGEENLDASALLIPLFGFLPADDPRVVNTLETLRRDLMQDGFLHRYDSDQSDDGLPPGEAPFLACTLWMADNLAMMGRREEALEVFERVLSVRNDLGLLAEEYDPRARRQLGNFPQGFSHVGIVNTAQNLSGGPGAFLESEEDRG